MSTILIADDEPDMADVFSEWLRRQYTVRTAYGGRAALREFDSDVDAIVLDRRMPPFSGDEVLQSLRGHGYDVPVGMVTAVEPTFDIIEMGFDDYVTKPVDRDEIMGLVEQLLAMPDLDEAIQNYYELASKKAALEASKPPAELQQSDRYQALLAELTTAEKTAEAATQKNDPETLYSRL